MKDTVVYVRRSKAESKTKKETGRDVHSLELQIQWAKQRCKKEKWRFLDPRVRTVLRGKLRVATGKYIDDGVSGVKIVRDSLGKLVNDICGDKIERVLIHRVDRLSRNMKVATAFLEFCEAKKVSVRFGDLWDTGSSTQMLVMILTAIAEYERAKTIDRIHAGLDIAEKEGKLAGRPPSGFTVDKETNTWVLKKDGKQVQLLLGKGKTPEEIRNATGIPITRIYRIIPRLEAYERAGMDGLREIVKEESKLTMERLAARDRRLEQEAKEFRIRLINLL